MKKKKDKNNVGSWRWWKPWTWFRKRSSKMYDEHNENEDVVRDAQKSGAEETDKQSYSSSSQQEDNTPIEAIAEKVLNDEQDPSTEALEIHGLLEETADPGNEAVTVETSATPSSEIVPQDSSVPTKTPEDSEPPSETDVPPVVDKQDSSLQLAFRIELEKCLTKEDFSAIRTFYEKIYNFKPRVGKAKEKYFETLDFTKVVIPYSESITLDKIRGFEEIGLECKFNPKEGILVIQGKPTKGYDGVIKIKVDCHVGQKRFVDDKKFNLEGEFNAKTWTCKAPLLINPDPWDLWENNPAPENGDYWKKDADKDSATLSDLPQITLLCASQRGRSHAQESKFRDDHFLRDVAQTPDQWSFIAVADGAGSAKFSREGSRIACETLVTAMKHAFCDVDGRYAQGIDSALRKRWSELSQGEAPKTGFEKCEDGALTFVPKPGDDPNQDVKPVSFNTLLYGGVHKVWTALTQAVADYNAPPETEDPNASRVNKKKPDEKDATIKDYSTTLLFAAVKRFPETETSKAFWAIITYWVGDGGLAIYRPNGRDAVIPMGAPDAGEYAGQTRFITMREEIDPAAVAKRVKVAFVEDFKALALMTDGLTDPFFPAESDLGKVEYWRQFWNETLQGKDERVHRFDDNDSQDFKGVLDKSRATEERAQSLLDGLMFKVKGNHDDRTIVLLINDDMSDEIPKELEMIETSTTEVVKDEATPPEEESGEAKLRDLEPCAGDNSETAQNEQSSATPDEDGDSSSTDDNPCSDDDSTKGASEESMEKDSQLASEDAKDSDNRPENGGASSSESTRDRKEASNNSDVE
ncbi:MAG: protein phosphatase 2C domain-containing protein [Thermoguttaceae bacterium]|nr:protein phosphatase 2C domain-containing protein [Thermoguttaceae bacterium]